MFSRRELIAELPRLAVVESPPMKFVGYGPQDFEPSASEQRIWTFRGSKRDFGSGMLFWVKSLQALDWGGRESYFASYAEAGRCQPLTEAEFAALLAEYSRPLLRPLPAFLLLVDGLVSGLRMYTDWNDVGAVAELDDAYVAFFWSTTA